MPTINKSSLLLIAFAASAIAQHAVAQTSLFGSDRYTIISTFESSFKENYHYFFGNKLIRGNMITDLDEKTNSSYYSGEGLHIGRLYGNNILQANLHEVILRDQKNEIVAMSPSLTSEATSYISGFTSILEGKKILVNISGESPVILDETLKEVDRLPREIKGSRLSAGSILIYQTDVYSRRSERPTGSVTKAFSLRDFAPINVSDFDLTNIRGYFANEENFPLHFINGLNKTVKLLVGCESKFPKFRKALCLAEKGQPMIIIEEDNAGYDYNIIESKNGKQFAVRWGSASGQFTKIYRNNGQVISTVKNEQSFIADDYPAMSFSPSGRYLIVRGLENKIGIFSTDSGKLLFEAFYRGGGVDEEYIQFSADERYLLIKDFKGKKHSVLELL